MRNSVGNHAKLRDVPRISPIFEDSGGALGFPRERTVRIISCLARPRGNRLKRPDVIIPDPAGHPDLGAVFHQRPIATLVIRGSKGKGDAHGRQTTRGVRSLSVPDAEEASRRLHGPRRLAAISTSCRPAGGTYDKSLLAAAQTTVGAAAFSRASFGPMKKLKARRKRPAGLSISI